MNERMYDIKRIIISVCDSKDSKKIVKKGIILAKLLGIKANIITVNDTYQFISSVVLEEKLKKEATSFLEDYKKIADNFGVKTETQLLVGKPAEEIVKFAKKNDLIIIGFRDKKTGIDKVIEKSILRDVIDKAPCSVLIVKKN